MSIVNTQFVLKCFISGYIPWLVCQSDLYCQFALSHLSPKQPYLCPGSSIFCTNMYFSVMCMHMYYHITVRYIANLAAILYFLIDVHVFQIRTGLMNLYFWIPHGWAEHTVIRSLTTIANCWTACNLNIITIEDHSLTMIHYIPFHNLFFLKVIVIDPFVLWSIKVYYFNRV